MTTMSQPDTDTGFLVAQLKREKNQVEQMKLLAHLQILTKTTRLGELAREFGLEPNMVYKAMNLVKLSSQVLKLVEVGDATGKKLPVATAHIIARQHVSKQLDLAERVLAEGISAPRLKKILGGKVGGADEATPSALEESTEIAKTVEPPLKQMLMALVRAEQSLAVLREFTWSEFRAAFESKEEIENLRRHLAYIGLRTGEFHEMLEVLLRTKFQ